MTRRVRVAHFPPPLRDPYLMRLCAELKLRDRYGPEQDAAKLSFGWLWAARHTVRILHFHWPSVFYETSRHGVIRNPLLRLVALLWFYTRLTWARLLGYRLVWTAHDLLPHGPYRRLYRLERRISCSLFWNGVIVHCPWAGEQVRRRFGFRRAVVIPHGNFDGVYPVGKAAGKKSGKAAAKASGKKSGKTADQTGTTADDRGKHLVRRRWNADKDATVLLHFGALRPYKGIETLLDAFARLGGQQENLHLVIAGGGPDDYMAQLAVRIGSLSRVHFEPGRVADDKVADLFAAADLVVLPYRNITTSGNLILALGFGKRVVIPAVGCVPFAAPPQSVILYTAETGAADGGTAALILAIRRALALDPERAADAARERVSQWDWPSIAHRTTVFYTEVGGG
ncbi:MAG: glycosyltransferase family 4 protein [Nitrospirota bacterium]|nr:glycosyltransferase family 4 protein [Nitrospirota bacterium]